MPKWPEKSSKSRYSEAFKDIAEKHFSNPEDFTDGKKVVIAVSHSDGYATFMKLFQEKVPKGKPCYCATVGIKFEMTEAGPVPFEIFHVIK